MLRRTKIIVAISGLLLAAGATGAAAIPVPSPDPCAIQGTVSTAKLAAYDKCRFDRIEAAIPGNQTVTQTVTATVTAPPVTVTATVTPTAPMPTPATTSASPSATPAPTSTQPAQPGACSVTTPNVPGGPDPWGGCWPGPATTGIAGCPALTVHNGTYWAGTDDVVENMEIRGQLRISERGAKNVKINCVKVTTATEYFPIDTERAGLTGPDQIVMDRVEVDCQGSQMAHAAFLLYGATVRHGKATNCADAYRIQDHSLVEDSYCGNLNVNGDPNNEWHYDCSQTIGAKNMTLRHNAFDGKDTSDVALWPDIYPIDGALVERNLLLGNVSYKVYVGKGNKPGQTKNVTVKDNRFGPGGYGPCSIDEAVPVWTGNVFNSDGSPLPMSLCV